MFMIYIGAYKKKMKSRIKAGENASIILERNILYDFLRNTKMVNFEGQKNKTGDNSNTFEYHPSGNKDYAQLWCPFYDEFLLDQNNSGRQVGNNLVSIKSFTSALKSYKKRLLSLSVPVSSVDLNYFQPIKPAGRLWQDSHVYSSVIFKGGQRKIEKRGGEYIMFHSTHLVRRYVLFVYKNKKY